jgi:hypothetical protein
VIWECLLNNRGLGLSTVQPWFGGVYKITIVRGVYQRTLVCGVYRIAMFRGVYWITMV